MSRQIKSLLVVLSVACGFADAAQAQLSPVALDITLPRVPPSNAQQYVAPQYVPVQPVVAQPVATQPPVAQPAPQAGPQPALAAPQPARPAPANLADQIGTTPALQRSWMADKPDYFKPFDMVWNDGKWFVSGYFGVGARANLSQLLFNFQANYERQFVVLGTLGREIGSLGNAMRFELETGLAAHFGRQAYVDAHLYFIVRWIWFPWNRWLPTTVALGTGPSMASAKPDLENEHGKAQRYSNGLLMELTLAPPDTPSWMFALRLHHRSGVLGLLNGSTPSDYVTVGIKHRF